MAEPTSRYLTLLDREIHLLDWGNPAAPPLVMWHGLARTARDFDDIAAHLSDTYRIIAPDTLGRGLSQWSPDPAAEYCLDFYGRLAVALLDQLGIGQTRWLGLSMGGAIGIHLAGGVLRDRISHLLINDIGPELARPAVERIVAYAGAPPAFDRLTALEAFLRETYRPYGALTDTQWRRMAETSARRLPDGRLTLHYDPRMVDQFTRHPQDYDQWPAYDRISARTLLLRGADSDLLLPEVAVDMTRRGPRCRLVTIPGCGHAPALNVPEQFALARDFFAEDPR